MASRDWDGDAEVSLIEENQRYLDHVYERNLIDLGLLTSDQIKEERALREQGYKATRDSDEHETYLRLKAKFEGA